MGTINVGDEPHELVIFGTAVFMQKDPSWSPAWATLLDTEITYSDPEAREKAHTAILEALCDMAHTKADADALRGIENLGTATLKHVAEEYAKLVVGFPTAPPSNSKRR